MADLETWKAWDAAVASGHINYLYKITFHGRNTDTIVPYVTGREEITFDGVTYLPHPCIHDEIKQDEVGAETGIRIPAARLWIETCLKHDPRVSLEILRWRDELNDAQSMFYGTLKETTFAGSDINLSFGNPLAAANVMLITYTTQRFCNHQMYGKLCGLDFDKYKVEFPEYEIQYPRTIHVPGASFDPDYWESGVFIYSAAVTDGVRVFNIEQSNMLRSVGSDSFELKYPLSPYFDTTVPILLAPNCLLDPKRCKRIFSNSVRATAWVDMPRSNYSALDVTQMEEGDWGTIGAPVKRRAAVPVPPTEPDPVPEEPTGE